MDEPSSPAFTTGPSTATFFSKLSVMFRSSLDTSIKPILCPRKSGPTHTYSSGHVGSATLLVHLTIMPIPDSFFLSWLRQTLNPSGPLFGTDSLPRWLPVRNRAMQPDTTFVPANIASLDSLRSACSRHCRFTFQGASGHRLTNESVLEFPPSIVIPRWSPSRHKLLCRRNQRKLRDSSLGSPIQMGFSPPSKQGTKR